MDIKLAFLRLQIQATYQTVQDLDLNTVEGKALLVNALLSLVVFPCEMLKKERAAGGDSKLLAGSYPAIRDAIGFDEQLFKPIKSVNSTEIKRLNRTLYSFMSKLRNAVAHQNIEWAGDGDDAILFRNYFTSWSSSGAQKALCEEAGFSYSAEGIEDFRIVMTFDQMKQFANWLALSYLAYASQNDEAQE